MGAPFEVIASPFRVFYAPYGEPFPDVDKEPAGNWVEMGTNGVKNLVEGGVKITQNQTLVFHRTEGVTAPIKASRTAEDMKISFALADLSPTFYSQAFRGDAPTPVAAATGHPGYKWHGFHRGPTVNELSLLVRSLASGSPLNTTGKTFQCQYEQPRVVHSGNPVVEYSKMKMASVNFEFDCLGDTTQTDARLLGRFVVQTADSL